MAVTFGRIMRIILTHVGVVHIILATDVPTHAHMDKPSLLNGLILEEKYLVSNGSSHCKFWQFAVLQETQPS